MDNTVFRRLNWQNLIKRLRCNNNPCCVSTCIVLYPFNTDSQINEFFHTDSFAFYRVNHDLFIFIIQNWRKKVKGRSPKKSKAEGIDLKLNFIISDFK